MRVAYLGPAGTFSEEAVRASGFGGTDLEGIPCDTIPEAIEAVGEGRADRAMVPLENSIEGSVHTTMDSLLEQADRVSIAAEFRHPIRSALIARTELQLDEISRVISHPQPLAQCSRFLRTEIPGAELLVAGSTSSAVREVSESGEPAAALGPSTAAGIYDCVVLREDIEDEAGNETRFIWIAPSPDTDASATSDAGDWKTTLVFSELGADHPGALVDALVEFSSREVNLVRIESRPWKKQLGRYLFYIDVEGREDDPPVAEALVELRQKAGMVKVLGTYPAWSDE
jgi:prephenate dehydratase